MNVMSLSRQSPTTAVCLQPPPREYHHVTLANDDHIPNTLHTRRCYTGVSLLFTGGHKRGHREQQTCAKCQQTQNDQECNFDI